MEFIWPQRHSLCVLEKAIVQATVDNTGVGDHKTLVMKHKNRVLFFVETRGL